MKNFIKNKRVILIITAIIAIISISTLVLLKTKNSKEAQTMASVEKYDEEIDKILDPLKKTEVSKEELEEFKNSLVYLSERIKADKSFTDLDSQEYQRLLDKAKSGIEITSVKIKEYAEIEETEAETEPETEAETEPETEAETEPEKISYKETKATKYAKSSVNVRKGPSTKYDKLGSVSKAQKVEVIGVTENGWSVIRYKNEDGYVSSKYLLDNKPEETVAKTETKATEKEKPKDKKPKETEAQTEAATQAKATPKEPAYGTTFVSRDGNENSPYRDPELYMFDWPDGTFEYTYSVEKGEWIPPTSYTGNFWGKSEEFIKYALPVSVPKGAGYDGEVAEMNVWVYLGK